MHDGRKPELTPPRIVGKGRKAIQIPEAFRFQFAVDPEKRGCSVLRLPTHGGRLLDAVNQLCKVILAVHESSHRFCDIDGQPFHM